ncbi:MAG: hypothetical protein N2749_00915 [Clostridia bacterium]|nr:hypothetical protein [Clostridia bacterium]
MVNSKELVIRGIINEERSVDLFDIPFEEKKDMLLKDIISPYNHPFMYEAEKLIIMFYHNTLIKNNKIPSIDEISIQVMNYNWNIMHKIAEIDFYTNHYKNTEYNLSSSDIEYCIAQIADNLLSSYYYDFFAENDEFITDVLDEKKLCYECSSDHILYQYFSRPDNNVEIYKNDCQILMFSDVHLEQMSFALNEIRESEVLNISIVNN